MTMVIGPHKKKADAKIDADAARASKEQARADRKAEDATLQTLTDWCSLVGANLDTLSYDEKRLALEALGVTVRIYRPSATDEAGKPLPRWEVLLRPASPIFDIVYHSTRRTRAASSWSAASWP